MTGSQSQHDAQAARILTAHLKDGEQLLAFTQGAVVASFARNYWLGLSAERLILVELNRDGTGGRSLSLRREVIRSVKWLSGLFASAIQIQLAKDLLRVSIRNNWKDRARALADLAAGPAPPPGPLPVTPEQFEQQMHDLRQLGFLATAAQLAQDALQPGSPLSDHAPVAAIKARLDDALLALRVAAGFLVTNLLVSAAINGLAALVDPQALSELCAPSLVSALIDLAIAASLWRGQTQWKAFAIVRVVLGAVVYGVLNAGLGDYLSFIPNIALAVALVLALTGRGERRRIYAAAAVFGLGYLGGIALIFVVSLVWGFFANVF
jgi:hypothetical protein